jgi:hypothetical protein
MLSCDADIDGYVREKYVKINVNDRLMVWRGNRGQCR